MCFIIQYCYLGINCFCYKEKLQKSILSGIIWLLLRYLKLGQSYSHTGMRSIKNLMQFKNIMTKNGCPDNLLEKFIFAYYRYMCTETSEAAEDDIVATPYSWFYHSLEILQGYGEKQEESNQANPPKSNCSICLSHLVQVD